jgi:hypothetical protein
VNAPRIAQPPGGFNPGNAFADEFSNLAAFLERLGGIGSSAVNLRSFDFDSIRPFPLLHLLLVSSLKFEIQKYR